MQPHRNCTMNAELKEVPGPRLRTASTHDHHHHYHQQQQQQQQQQKQVDVKSRNSENLKIRGASSNYHYHILQAQGVSHGGDGRHGDARHDARQEVLDVDDWEVDADDAAAAVQPNTIIQLFDEREKRRSTNLERKLNDADAASAASAASAAGTAETFVSHPADGTHARRGRAAAAAAVTCAYPATSIGWLPTTL
eukprot:gene616-28644_t